MQTQKFNEINQQKVEIVFKTIIINTHNGIQLINQR